MLQPFCPLFRPTSIQEQLSTLMNGQCTTVCSLFLLLLPMRQSTIAFPVTGVHTQNVESYWNWVKIKLKRMKGCHADKIPEYLDEFMWRERYGEFTGETFENLAKDIADLYPV